MRQEPEVIVVEGNTAETSAVTSDRELLWEPTIGEQLQAVLQRVPEGSREDVRREALGILGRCLPPGRIGRSRTGLVVGYVQSGKTLSFTAVSALAHDNGYRLLIVIAGISTPLLRQSTDRLREDLSAEGWWGPWRVFRSDEDEIVAGDPSQIQATLDRWDDPRADDEERKTVLITVMKERHHLERVITILERLELAGVPVLVIDDEADQASLNRAVRDNDESATYQRILRIRSLLPHHSFLQYTATPQALLLINLIDQLSPDLGVVLTPGEDYTGGEAFFHGSTDLIREIPPEDLPGRGEIPDAPPASLLEALRLFFVGVAVGRINRSDEVLNRSMMIHPTYRVDPQAEHVLWVRQIQNAWGQLLQLDDGDPDREELLQEFLSAYEDLSSTAEELPPFDDVVRKLPFVVRDTRIEEVNARERPTPEISWPRYYSWILVGGQAMDRGFTVEGLTVTYMPRGLGVGNADTIQQRARWFGYKQSYLGLCRVFLPSEAIRAYTEYVRHEEYVRSRLKTHLEEGHSLKTWKRAFIMGGGLRPTRNSVVASDIRRGMFRDRWFSPRSPHANQDAVERNKAATERFLKTMEWKPWSEDERLRDTHRHVFTSVPLSRVQDLLLDVVCPVASDSADLNGILVQISAYLEEQRDAVATAVRMRPGITTARGTDDAGVQITELFQGAWPVEGDEKIYPGDRGVRCQEGLTLQIHLIDLYKGRVDRGQLIEAAVPTIGVWVPREMAAPWVVQEQG